MRGLRIVVASIVVVSALFAAGPAAAARPTSQYYFYDCTGDGPSSFYAVKTATPPQSGNPVSAGAAYALLEGTGNYSLVSFGEGNFDPPGIKDSSSYNLVCKTTFAGQETTVYGVYTGR